MLPKDITQLTVSIEILPRPVPYPMWDRQVALNLEPWNLLFSCSRTTCYFILAMFVGDSLARYSELNCKGLQSWNLSWWLSWRHDSYEPGHVVNRRNKFDLDWRIEKIIHVLFSAVFSPLDISIFLPCILLYLSQHDFQIFSINIRRQKQSCKNYKAVPS